MSHCLLPDAGLLRHAVAVLPSTARAGSPPRREEDARTFGRGQVADTGGSSLQHDVAHVDGAAAAAAPGRHDELDRRRAAKRTVFRRAPTRTRSAAS